MDTVKRITSSADQCGGHPCIRGLRIRVKDILLLMSHGASTQEILEDYPYLESEDLTAVLQFAAEQIDHPILEAA